MYLPRAALDELLMLPCLKTRRQVAIEKYNIDVVYIA